MGSRLISICCTGLNPADFSGRLVLPVAAGLERKLKGHGAGAGAIVNAAAAVPAFIRMEDNRGFTLNGIRDVNINLADFNAMVAAVADFLVKDHRGAGGGDIRNSR
jgi:hypothetical protein